MRVHLTYRWALYTMIYGTQIVLLCFCSVTKHISVVPQVTEEIKKIHVRQIVFAF